MTPLAILLIAASAGLHATWHMFAKKTGASLAFLASLAYYSFRAVELAAAQWIVVLAGRKTRAEAVALLHGNLPMTLAAGVCASLTYLLVLVAMNFVTNVAYVQAFRQIGLLIGLAEGVFILHERCTAPKLVGFALILTGLAALFLCVA